MQPRGPKASSLESLKSVRMVGPGHSKGCGTCRRRKVKCDEGQPRCLRCARAGLVCEGYMKEFRWVDESRSRSQSRARHKDEAPRMRSPEANDGDDVLIARFVGRVQRGLSPYSNDAYVAYTVKNLFHSESESQEYSYQSWIKDTLNANSDSVAYSAFQCLAAACFGRMHARDPRISAKAAQLYGMTLSQLRDSIENPQTCYDPCNISATMALHLYETIAYTSGIGWIQHAGGAGRLIELRGPEKHQDWPEHGYFTLLRPRVVFQAIISRKRSFLERDEWKTIPWAKHPETKTFMQQLLDIAAHIPGIQQDWIAAKAIAANRTDLLSLSRRFIPRVQLLLESVFRWRWAWEAEHPHVAMEVPVDPQSTHVVSPDDGNVLFPTVLVFTNMSRADEINLYNCITILLMHCSNICHGDRNPVFVAQCVRNSLPSNHPPPVKRNPPLSLPNEHEDYNGMADEIARTVDYCLQDHHISQGVYSLLLPLRMCTLAYSFFACIPKLRWTIAIAKTCADRSAFELSRHMTRPQVLGTSNREIEGLTDRIRPDVRAAWDLALQEIYSENVSIAESSTSNVSSSISGHSGQSGE